MKNERTAQKTERWVHALSRKLNIIAIIVLFLVTMLIAVDVIGRYVFNQPVSGSTELIQFALVILVFSSLAYCACEDGNVRVDVIYARLPSHIRIYLDIFTSFLSLIIIVFITWQLTARAFESLGGMIIRSELFQWPLWPFLLMAALGTGLLSLEILVWLIRSISHIWRK
jgi:TRAP-type C4-dicarboxylate transport system permease small subunit